MLPTSLLLQWPTNERPSDDSAKLKTTATANRAGPGSRAVRLGDSAASLAMGSAGPDGAAAVSAAGDSAAAVAAAPLVTALAASAAASLARPIVVVRCGVGNGCVCCGWEK